MRIKILALISTLLLCLNVTGQSSGFYYKYDFRTYLNSKTVNSNEYVQLLQDRIKYPAIAKENEIEGKLECLLINTGDNESQIIVKKQGLKSKKEDFNEFYLPYFIFEREIQIAFHKVDAKMLIDNQEKFISEFSIVFKIESTERIVKEHRNTDVINIENRIKTSIKIMN